MKSFSGSIKAACFITFMRKLNGLVSVCREKSRTGNCTLDDLKSGSWCWAICRKRSKTRRRNGKCQSRNIVQLTTISDPYMETRLASNRSLSVAYSFINSEKKKRATQKNRSNGARADQFVASHNPGWLTLIMNETKRLRLRLALVSSLRNQKAKQNEASFTTDNRMFEIRYDLMKIFYK